MRTRLPLLIVSTAMIILVLGVSAVLAAPREAPQGWGDHDAMHAQMRVQMQEHMSPDAVEECDAMHASMGAMHGEMMGDMGAMHGEMNGMPGGMMGGGR
jgi:hypothetical protein